MYPKFTDSDSVGICILMRIFMCNYLSLHNMFNYFNYYEFLYTVHSFFIDHRFSLNNPVFDHNIKFLYITILKQLLKELSL